MILVGEIKTIFWEQWGYTLVILIMSINYFKLLKIIKIKRGQSDATEGLVLALHMANPGLIPVISYDFHSTSRINS